MSLAFGDSKRIWWLHERARGERERAGKRECEILKDWWICLGWICNCTVNERVETENAMKTKKKNFLCVCACVCELSQWADTLIVWQFNQFDAADGLGWWKGSVGERGRGTVRRAVARVAPGGASHYCCSRCTVAHVGYGSSPNWPAPNVENCSALAC